MKATYDARTDTLSIILKTDAVVTAALDGVGAGVAAYFAQLKRDEFFDWHNTVSAWEIDRYLTAF